MSITDTERQHPAGYFIVIFAPTWGIYFSELYRIFFKFATTIFTAYMRDDIKNNLQITEKRKSTELDIDINNFAAV